MSQEDNILPRPYLRVVIAISRSNIEGEIATSSTKMCYSVFCLNA